MICGQIKMVIMSQAKLLLLAAFFSALIFLPSNSVLAQVPLAANNVKPFDQNSSKIVDVKNNPDGTKTVTYRDAGGNMQLAALDCNNVPDFPGLQGLCGVLDSGFTALGASIKGAIDGIMDNFLTMLSQQGWNILFNVKNSHTGVVTMLMQGFNNMLWGIDPGSYNAQGASVDQQKPVSHGFPPFRLISAIYQNPPNMETMGALAYTVNKNLLGVTTALAMNCGDPNNRTPSPNGRTKPGDFYDEAAFPANTANVACPGRIRLNPMYPIWEVVRDIAYVTVVLILVIFGVMVMFRSKIDPRTVITVQSAIPRLAIGLVAIAFSYIIASLAVDIGQVGLAAVGQFFNRIAALGLPIEKSGGGALSPFPYFDTLRGFNDKLSLNYDYTNIPLVPSVIGLIAWMIIFQVFFALVTNYAQIFVKVALGPLVIALGIIPGQSDALAKWFKGLLANALVFPGIYFIVNIIVYIDTFVNSLYLPSPLNDDVKGFVMLGLFVIATKVPAVIEEFLGTQQSGGVSRAGADVSQMARKIPVVGTFF